MKAYYELTKKEYKKYEKQFNKTFIGKQLFLLQLVFSIFFVLMFLMSMFEISSTLTLNDATYHIVGSVIMLWFGISFLIFTVEYRKELKNYIIEKNK